MTSATIKAMFDSYAEIAIAAHESGKRVEFEETTARGGVVYLVAKVSVRPEVAEDADQQEAAQVRHGE